MEASDTRNISLISSIVEKHFGLSEKSLDYFKKELNEPNLDIFYKKLFKDNDDLRIRFKIPKEICSNLDNGWKIFSSCFARFMEKYGFNYTNFVENKVLVEKNSVKTRKALVGFYTNPENYIPFRKDIGTKVRLESMDWLKSWETKKMIEPKLLENIIIYIDAALDNISQKCLPKSDIQLVISCNFADWFLCSTAESWKSCLNLESEFHAAYWSGLPGLIGDKNRCMLYITDGNKKTYQGISVDKVIARSWGLLSSNDYVNIIKPYPLADIFDSRIVNSITGLKVRDFCGIPEFTSKNKIDLLYLNYKEKEISSFIFQDNTGFGEDGHIHKNHNGIYIFINKILTRGEPTIRYDQGLAYLIANKESIEKYIIKKDTCEVCGGSSEEVSVHVVDGVEHHICPHCFKERYKRCPDCREYHAKDSFVNIQMENGDSSSVCPSCLTKKYSKCETCGKYYSNKELYNVFDADKNKTRVCASCVKEMPDLVRCQECGSYMPESMIVQANLAGTEFMCSSCINKHADKNQILFDFATEPKAGYTLKSAIIFAA